MTGDASPVPARVSHFTMDGSDSTPGSGILHPGLRRQSRTGAGDAMGTPVRGTPGLRRMTTAGAEHSGNIMQPLSCLRVPCSGHIRGPDPGEGMGRRAGEGGGAGAAATRERDWRRSGSRPRQPWRRHLQRVGPLLHQNQCVHVTEMVELTTSCIVALPKEQLADECRCPCLHAARAPSRSLPSSLTRWVAPTPFDAAPTCKSVTMPEPTR